MHGDSLPMLSPLGLSNRKPLPLGMGYITIWQNPNKGKSLAKVPNKETVEVLQEYNYTWAKIRYKGTVGYSDRQYLEKV